MPMEIQDRVWVRVAQPLIFVGNALLTMVYLCALFLDRHCIVCLTVEKRCGVPESNSDMCRSNDALYRYIVFIIHRIYSQYMLQQGDQSLQTYRS
jgi:hypothetical protein